MSHCSEDLLFCGKLKSKVSHSSDEAEYRAMSIATREIIWLRQLLTDLDFPPT